MARAVIAGLDRRLDGSWSLESWDNSEMSYTEYAAWLAEYRPDAIMVAYLPEDMSINDDVARERAYNWLQPGAPWVNTHSRDAFTAYVERKWSRLDEMVGVRVQTQKQNSILQAEPKRKPLAYFTEHKSFADSQFEGFEVERGWTSNAQGMAEPQQWFDRNDADVELWRKGN